MSSISPTSARIHALQTGTAAINELQRSGQGRETNNLLRVLAAWTEPTVYLPTHDPAAVGRLTQRQVVDASPVRLPA